VDPVPDPLLFFLVVPGIEPGPPDLQPRTLTTRRQRRSPYVHNVHISKLFRYYTLFAIELIIIQISGLVK
jgi:hypothetical protein